MRCNALQCAAMRCNALQCATMRYNALQAGTSHAVTSCNKFNLDELLGTCQASASALCPLVIWARKPHTRSLAGSALFSRYSHMLLSLAIHTCCSAVHKQKHTAHILPCRDTASSSSRNWFARDPLVSVQTRLASSPFVNVAPLESPKGVGCNISKCFK